MDLSEDKPTILLADDNPDHRELWARYLAYDDYRVETAADGREALRILEHTPVQLVLLDLMMPEVDGFQVLAELRKRVSPEQLPVILTTGRDATDDVVRGFELGANDYVTKAIDPKVLSARIRSRLRSSRARLRSSRARLRSRRAPAAAGDPTAGPGASRARSSTDEPAERPLAAGTVLADRYRVEELIGRGGFGAVYRATHLGLSMPVALKLLIAPGVLGASRLRREGVSACRLEHPNAVRVMDFCIPDSDPPFLVLELLDGHPLDLELERERSLTPERCAQLLRPLCNVLAAAHAEGIVHRDVKPHNVFLHRARGREVVKVLDFGLAKLLDDADPTRTQTLDGRVLGTPAYMAPERFADEPYDGRADVYSLGVMLYEMLTGVRPFVRRTLPALMRAHVLDDPDPPTSLRCELSPIVEAVVLSALDKDPERRPSAEALADAFEAALRA